MSGMTVGRASESGRQTPGIKTQARHADRGGPTHRLPKKRRGAGRRLDERYRISESRGKSTTQRTWKACPLSHI